MLTRLGKCLVVGIFLMIIFLLLTYYFIFRAVSVSTPVTFVIESGDTVTAIATRLEEKGLVRSKLAFRMFMRLKGLNRGLQPGTVSLSDPVTVPHIANLLSLSRPEEKTITILPGWDLRDIGEYLATQGVVVDFSEQGSLEGYLAPDTYRIFADATPEEVIKKLSEERNSQFTEKMNTDILAQKRTVHEVITLASILEREVQTKEDQKKVADILWRRTDKGWPLQVDSSIHYILGTKGNVFTTAKDRQIDSPWNTYKYKGLPPGPISTPSVNAIMAAIYPEKNDYWFFLTTKDGTVIYSKTLEEQNRNAQKYLRS